MDACAEAARTKAVDDANFVNAGHDAAVDERLQLLQRVFYAKSYQIDFVRCIAFDDWRDDFHDSRFRRFVLFRRLLEIGGFHCEIDAIDVDDDGFLVLRNGHDLSMRVEAFDPDFLADLQFICCDGCGGTIRRRAETFLHTAFAIGDFFTDFSGIDRLFAVASLSYTDGAG